MQWRAEGVGLFNELVYRKDIVAEERNIEVAGTVGEADDDDNDVRTTEQRHFNDERTDVLGRKHGPWDGHRRKQHSNSN